MNCACQINVGDGESEMIELTAKWIRGEEAHCSECKELVEEFLLEVYIGQNLHAVAFTTCRSCWHLREALFCDYPTSGIWDAIEEAMEESAADCKEFVVPESCLSKLTPKARASVCEMLERHWVDLEVG